MKARRDPRVADLIEANAESMSGQKKESRQSVKEPHKYMFQACRISKLAGLGQQETAAIMSKKMTRPVSQTTMNNIVYASEEVAN